VAIKQRVSGRKKDRVLQLELISYAKYFSYPNTSVRTAWHLQWNIGYRYIPSAGWLPQPEENPLKRIRTTSSQLLDFCLQFCYV
jgi:hypothetical protein